MDATYLNPAVETDRLARATLLGGSLQSDYGSASDAYSMRRIDPEAPNGWPIMDFSELTGTLLAYVPRLRLITLVSRLSVTTSISEAVSSCRQASHVPRPISPTLIRRRILLPASTDKYAIRCISMSVLGCHDHLR